MSEQRPTLWRKVFACVCLTQDHVLQKETEYVKSQRLARISTVSPESLQPDVVPVGFDCDGTNFYVGGKNLLNSTKYKNVMKNNKVTLAIDDLKPGESWEPAA